MSKQSSHVLLAGLWITFAITGCGSDGGEPNEPTVNLEEVQISVDGRGPALAMGADGRYAVTWEPGPSEGTSLPMQRFTAGGFKDASKVDVSQFQGAAYLARVAFGPQGESYVAWGQLNTYVQRYAAGGSASGAATLVRSSSPSPSYPYGLDFGAGGQGVLLWSDETASGVRVGARRLAADGSARGSDLIVASGLSGGGFVAGAQTASTAVLPDGRFLVSWWQIARGSASTQIQRFSAEGAPVGPRISLDALSSSRRTERTNRVEAAPGGGFVATWLDAAHQIEGQRFAADGSRVGGRFTAGVADEWASSVGPDGGMVVARSVNTSGATYSITAQRLAADGTPQGAEISVASGRITLRGVALGPDGRFFVVWEGLDNGGIRGRLFAE